jgi:hypothetical protein
VETHGSLFARAEGNLGQPLEFQERPCHARHHVAGEEKNRFFSCGWTLVADVHFYCQLIAGFEIGLASPHPGQGKICVTQAMAEVEKRLNGHIEIFAGVGIIGRSRPAMARISPYFPLSHGGPRVDDRRVVSGIVYVIRRSGARWVASIIVALALARRWRVPRKSGQTRRACSSG